MEKLAAEFFLCAGGTGGHIFPAECVANELISRGYKVTLITDERYKNYENNQKKFAIVKIPSAKISGGVLAKFKAMPVIIKGVFVARKIIKSAGDSVTVGFGGYPSFPGVIGGILAGSKTAIHEQNAVFGRANLVLSHFVKLILLSFEHTKKIKYSEKSIFVGNPIRKIFSEIPNYQPPADNEKIKVMVIGGSLGAAVFSEILPSAIKKIKRELLERIEITQQCREADLQKVRQDYDNIGIKYQLASFFADYPKRLKTTHLVISRAGASSVFEILTAGRPAIFLPYKLATDNHQYENAKAFEGYTIALVSNDEVAKLEEFFVRKLAEILENPGVLAECAKKMQLYDKADATQKFADILVKYVNSGDATETIKESIN